MNTPNIQRTDSSLWAEIDALSKLTTKEALLFAKKPSDFVYSKETIELIRSHPEQFNLKPSSTVEINHSAIRALGLDKPATIEEIMKGGSVTSR